ELLEEGNTVPFIARYRKEMTSGLDEVEIKLIQDTFEYATQLKERKEEVIRLIDEQEKLTEELAKEINAATKLQRVEDLYRPYRKKRRTRATVAKEKGLEPLAKLVWEQSVTDVSDEIPKYFNEEHDVKTETGVLNGVNDIIAEWISDHAQFREEIRRLTWQEGKLQTSLKNGKLDEAKTYAIYYDFSQAVRQLVSHRVLAINRGEKEDILRVTIVAPEEKILTYLEKEIVKVPEETAIYEILLNAIEDSYKRLLQPAVERDVRSRLTEEARSEER